MPWTGGSYTKGNNSTGGWAGDAAAGIGIEAGRHDTQDNDFATGINQCLNKDGSNAATGNLNFGGYLPTNIGAGTAAAPAICAGNDTNTGVFSPAADTWAVATNGSERLRTDSIGRLGLNTTSPSHMLHVDSTSNSYYPLWAYMNAASSQANGAGVFVKRDNDTTTSNRFILFYVNAGATASGAIVANGASAAAFASFSDERLKTNIQNLPNQLDNILALRPVEFDYKDGSGHQIGFIAQEVNNVFPDLVGQSEGFLTLTDLNKNDARLIKAIQELNAKVVALEARVAALEP